jgi:ParB family chromosome partitioning protein
LGRGLGALIAAKPQEAGGEGLREVPLELIERSPQQPRMRMDAAALRELADSIRQSGVVQPVVLRPRGERYELIAGERRFRAAKMAGLETVPAVVRYVSDENMLEMALVENIQRENLSPVEEALAYKRLTEAFSLTQAQVASKVGKDRATVANTLRLLTLPKRCQDLLNEGGITAGHAKALLSLPDAARQTALAERISAGGLSVREAERLAREGVPSLGGRRRSEKPKDPNVRKAEEELQRALGTKVVICEQGKQKGILQIHYYSQDELHRLYLRLNRKK